MVPYKAIDEESSLQPRPIITELPYGARIRNSYLKTRNYRMWFCTLCSLILLIIVLSNIDFSYQVVVRLETDRVLCRTNKRFLSVALDSSLIRERWKNLNISSAKFLLMAKYLAPGYLRIGGTLADRLIFNASATDQSKLNTNIVDDQMANQNLLQTDHINETVCSLVDGENWSHSDQVDKHFIHNFTMTGTDWILINNFATNAGFKLLFDLNVLLRDGDNWNSSNAFELIKFSDEHAFDVDWQLGNEPNSFRHVFNVSISGDQLGRDFTSLKNILKSFPRYNNSLLVGPDVTRPKMLDDPATDYLKDFLDNVNNSINAVTWHQYYLNGHTAHLDDVTPQSLNVFYQQINRVRTTVKTAYNHTTSPPIWISETGSAYGGGARGLSDSFVAGFLWLDKLGVAAREGIDLVVRQSLYHGYYSLLDEALDPLPDWWLSIIYKTFVGPNVIEASKLLGPVRIYCHCTPSNAAMTSNGTVTVFGMNMLNNEAIVVLDSQPSTRLGGHIQVYQYILTGEEGLGSKSVLLNNIRLEIRPDGSLPPFKPVVKIMTSELSLPPYSLGFFVLHGVNVPACLEIA